MPCVSYIFYFTRISFMFLLNRKCDFSTACIILFITFFTQCSLDYIVFFKGFFAALFFIMHTLNVLIKRRLFGYSLCMYFSVVFYNYFIRVAFNRHIAVACLFAFNCNCLKPNRTRCTHTVLTLRIKKFNC